MQLLRGVVTSLVVILGTVVGVAAAEPLPKLAGQDYGKARAALLRQDWQPVTLPDADRCMASDQRCAGRPEMHACAGTGLAPCIFIWRRRATTIEVVTEGEDPVVRRVRVHKD